jgi:hypothetical protein
MVHFLQDRLELHSSVNRRATTLPTWGTTSYRGEPLHNPERNFHPVKLGNEVALNVGPGGCGTGRTLYGQAGSQGQHGAVAGSPKPQGRPILSQYGPDYKVPGR